MLKGNDIIRHLTPAFLAGVLLFTAVSCGKNIDNSTVQLGIDKKKIEAFLDTYCLSPAGEIVPLPAENPGDHIPLRDTAQALGNMYIVHLQQGLGEPPNTKSRVLMDFQGFYMEGLQMFDSTSETGPYEAWIAGVIQGMSQGLLQMKTAEVTAPGQYNTPGKAWLIIPSTMAFGNDGKTDPPVPPNTCVLYRVTLYTITGQNN